MFFTLYEIFTLSFKFNEVVSGVMNSKVDEFLSYLNKPKLFFNFVCSRKHFLTREKQTN